MSESKDYTKPARQPGVYWVRYETTDANGGKTNVNHVAQYYKSLSGEYAGLYVWAFLGYNGKEKTKLDDYFTEIGPKIELPSEWAKMPLNVTTHMKCGCKITVYDPKLEKEPEFTFRNDRCNHDDFVTEELFGYARQGYQQELERQKEHS